MTDLEAREAAWHVRWLETTGRYRPNRREDFYAGAEWGIAARDERTKELEQAAEWRAAWEHDLRCEALRQRKCDCGYDALRTALEALESLGAPTRTRLECLTEDVDNYRTVIEARYAALVEAVKSNHEREHHYNNVRYTFDSCANAVCRAALTASAPREETVDG